MIDIRNLSYQAGKKKIINEVSTQFAPGLFHVIVGPNGSGKSTFLKLFSGTLTPHAGQVLYNDADISRTDSLVLARQRAVMSQHTDLHFPLPVREVVMMGRYPYFTFHPTADDKSICEEVMQQMQISSFSDRDYLTLSGGEQQRVQFARVLAQVGRISNNEQKFLFLDEAVSNLDIKYQHLLLDTAKALCRQQVTVICILHDLNLTIRYADRVIFMKEGMIAAEVNSPGELTPALIHRVFDVHADVIRPDGKRPMIFFTG